MEIKSTEEILSSHLHPLMFSKDDWTYIKDAMRSYTEQFIDLAADKAKSEKRGNLCAMCDCYINKNSILKLKELIK